METKTTKIRLDSIDFSDDSLQGVREDLALIGRAISRTALDVLLDLCPVTVSELPRKRFRVVTGDAQLRIARAALAAKDSIPVKCIVGGPDVEELYSDVDQMVLPFVLARKVEQIESALKGAEAGRTQRLGRDLERPETRRAMLAQLKALARKSRAGKSDGAPDTKL